MRAVSSIGFSFLSRKIEDWGRQRGILQHDVIAPQATKLLEEASETLVAAQKLDSLNLLSYDQAMEKYGSVSEYEKYKEELRSQVSDGIGDTQVVLILLAELYYNTEGIQRKPEFHYSPLLEMLSQAYNTIKQRTGKLVNGVFIKDE